MATKKSLTEIEKRALARYTDTSGAKGFGAWLAENGKTAEADKKRQAAATAARRETYGNRAAESLAALGIAEDGYAAYLRRAAKEAREARTKEIESGRADEGARALAGYAAYLDGVRKENGERLTAAAETLLSTPHTEEEASALAGTATDRADAKAALLSLYRTRGAQGSADTAKVVKAITEASMPYGRAYEYCRLLGYSEEMARRIAGFTAESGNRYTEELWELFGYT